MKDNNDRFDEDGFYEDLKAFRAQLADPEKSASAKPSDLIGRELLKMCWKYTFNHHFKWYPPELKEEMVATAMWKCTRGLTLFDMSRRDKLASYFLRIMHFSFLDVIGTHYRRINTRREYVRAQLKRMGLPNSEIDKIEPPFVPSGVIKKGETGPSERSKAKLAKKERKS